MIYDATIAIEKLPMENNKKEYSRFIKSLIKLLPMSMNYPRE